MNTNQVIDIPNEGALCKIARRKQKHALKVITGKQTETKGGRLEDNGRKEYAYHPAIYG